MFERLAVPINHQQPGVGAAPQRLLRDQFFRQRVIVVVDFSHVAGTSTVPSRRQVRMRV